ncbi:hypothetical protein SJAG_03812 [Schizosaccharomyces japonicus yFS275]|uniref:Endoplasmic reticulum junction formation protein lunapark n=1 Tax=Schizosaccharomyces japonicus (strain yFS275 / FY16936) TaxID=402676 RepID=B6K546_SCHJY|nr:hypothetical protein SJAG_03812 [Schizosaccharomyces japonicus yFS275]EEB08650.2 hypothetical protein SJAG_03812 [Schizosaccharomyces japonicus yFS275]
MNWFSRKRRTFDYEEALDDIAEKLEELKLDIHRNRMRQRQWSWKWFLGSSTMFTIVFAGWSWHCRSLWDLPVWIVWGLKLNVYVLGIFLSWSVKECITWMFGVILRRKKAQHRHCLEEKRVLIESLKSRKEYFETQALLERYAGVAPETGSTRASFSGGAPVAVGAADAAAGDPSSQANASSENEYPKKWYDKLLEKIVGGPERDVHKCAALICSTCFRHNGLAPPDVAASDVSFICAYCRAWNGPVPTLKTNPPSEPVSVPANDNKTHGSNSSSTNSAAYLSPSSHTNSVRGSVSSVAEGAAADTQDTTNAATSENAASEHR